MNLGKEKIVSAENKGDFLEHKTKKTWETITKSGKRCKCFRLYARSLQITWGNREYWIWDNFKETSAENIEVAELSHVCWLNVSGKFLLSKLSPGTLYEVVYQVKLRKGASGWEPPINLKLSLPGNIVQERQVSLLYQNTREWIDLNVGNFRTKDNGETSKTKEISFELYEHSNDFWKNGLFIRGVVIRPKED